MNRQGTVALAAAPDCRPLGGLRQHVAFHQQRRHVCYHFRFLTHMCARFSPSRSAAPWEEAADVLVPANQR